MSEEELLELRKALFACISHFRDLETLYRVLRLKLEYPHPGCLNTAEINRLAIGLNRGPVFLVESKDEETQEVAIYHPTATCPAFFSVHRGGMLPLGISEYSRKTAESNLEAWLELTSTDVQPEKPKRRSVTKEKKTDDRDKWIYDQCCKGIPHEAIVAELRKRSVKRGWRLISSKQRVQQIGNEYADRHEIERPGPRQNL